MQNMFFFKGSIMSANTTPILVPGNLTSITWAHAVNSQALLNEALSSKLSITKTYHVI